jgi:hypothetical protein
VGFFETPGNAYGVAVVDNYAYVADNIRDLRVIDVSAPTSPTEVGFFETPGYAEGVAVVDNYAYVAAYDSGLRVIDVSAPTSPTEVGFFETPGNAYGVAVVDNYAYVADGHGGLWILQFTGGEPSQPRLAINYSTGAPGSYFTITGSDFPLDSSVPITINRHELGTSQADETGSFTLLLTTDNADAGGYLVTGTTDTRLVTATNREGQVSFTLDPEAPLRPQEGKGETFDVPVGLAFTNYFLYLPAITR